MGKFLRMVAAALTLAAPGLHGDVIYVSDVGNGTAGAGVIYQYSNGIRTTFASGLDFPLGLAFDNKWNLYEADAFSGNIFEFSPDGNQTTYASGLSEPFGLAYEGSGTLSATNDLGGGFFGGTSSPGSSAPAETTLAFPTGLAFDAYGNLYVSDLGFRRPAPVESFMSSLPEVAGAYLRQG